MSNAPKKVLASIFCSWAKVIHSCGRVLFLFFCVSVTFVVHGLQVQNIWVPVHFFRWASPKMWCVKMCTASLAFCAKFTQLAESSPSSWMERSPKTPNRELVSKFRLRPQALWAAYGFCSELGIQSQFFLTAQVVYFIKTAVIGYFQQWKGGVGLLHLQWPIAILENNMKLLLCPA